ncbi:hypothetical protein EWB00_002957 [Schistosoma japonicum]|uniref:Uncharacterized protein n=1 Tax=Schistosoma japonicum TaxID=6182 RepID=A0A4Z2DB89_SCHJA|nr:hypothetical protein EWB00_002957 [Schistosoma japonicum]
MFLQLLHVCVDGDQEEALLSQPDGLVETDRRRIEAYQLLRLFHQLEISKSSGRVGLLAEDMLNDWASTEDNSGNVSLKDSTDHHHCTIGQLLIISVIKKTLPTHHIWFLMLSIMRIIVHPLSYYSLVLIDPTEIGTWDCVAVTVGNDSGGILERLELAMVETDRLNKMTAVIQKKQVYRVSSVMKDYVLPQMKH